MDLYAKIKQLFGWGPTPAARPTPESATDEAHAANGAERRVKMRTNARPGTRIP